MNALLATLLSTITVAVAFDVSMQGSDVGGYPHALGVVPGPVADAVAGIDGT